MAMPLAAIRSDKRESKRSKVEAGKTLSSAPESIRKYRPERFSKLDMVEVLKSELGAATDNWPWRFPELEDGVGPDHP